MSSGRKAFGPRFYRFLIVASFAYLGAGVLRVMVWLESESTRVPAVDPDAVVAPLIPGLTASDGAARVAAIRGLGEVLPQFSPSDDAASPRARALAALRGALRDQEPQVRAAAAVVLGSLFYAGRVATGDLRKAALNDQDHEVRLAAATALLKFGREDDALALRVLTDLLADPKVTVDRRPIVAAMALAGEAGQDEAIRRLVSLLADEDEVERLEAVKCVSALGVAAPRIVPKLEPLWSSDDPGIRFTVALAVMETIESVQPLDPRVQSALALAVADTSRTLDQRRDALEKLAGWAPGACRPAGLELARQLSREDIDIRLTAATLLQMIPLEYLAGKPVPTLAP